MDNATWKLLRAGKIREIYTSGGNELVFYASDKISAFDKVLPTFIPGKGKILTLMSEKWFELLKQAEMSVSLAEPQNTGLRGLKLAYIPCDFNPESPYAKFGRMPYIGRAMLMRKLEMLPIECIVRGYLTGSGLKSYQRDGSVCGVELPAGLKEASRLPSAIYTPTTKAETGHDEHVSYMQTVELIDQKFPGHGADLAYKAKAYSLAIYQFAEEYARERGIIIADTKFEFGVGDDGELYLADEVLTPDSSRFWPVADYAEGRVQPSFDKQVVRDFLMAHPGADRRSLPPAVVDKTIRCYEKAYNMLFAG